VRLGVAPRPDELGIEGKTQEMNGHSLFTFQWSEHGGPPVTVPTRKGFGSAILGDAAKQFAQNVSVDYNPKGLRYELQVPLRSIQALPPPNVIA
jgi:two-component sensor histidine kinase